MPEASATGTTGTTRAQRWAVVAGSRPPLVGAAAWDDAAALARGGHDVVLVVTDDVVADLARGAAWLDGVLADGVRVLVDVAAARRRALHTSLVGTRAVRQVSTAELGALMAASDVRMVWR